MKKIFLPKNLKDVFLVLAKMRARRKDGDVKKHLQDLGVEAFENSFTPGQETKETM